MAATLEDLERRVVALEKAQNETTASLRWLLGTVAEIKAVQDIHTETLADHTRRLERVEDRLGRVESKLDTLGTTVEALPRAMAEMVQESEARLLDAIRAR